MCSHSRYANPAKNSPSVPIVAYNLAISNAGGPAVLWPPPRPEKMAPSELVELALPEVAEEVALVEFGGEGSCAPHGWSCVHAAWHVELLSTQASWHWMPHCTQVK